MFRRASRGARTFASIGFSSSRCRGAGITQRSNDDGHQHLLMILVIIVNERAREAAMRITKETTAANRERVLEAAARLFREKGVDGIAVAELMQAAGLTHGGFYNHFESKEELAAAAFKTAFDAAVARLDRQAAKAGRDGRDPV